MFAAGAGMRLFMLLNEFVELVFGDGFFKVHNIHLLDSFPGYMSLGYKKIWVRPMFPG